MLEKRALLGSVAQNGYFFLWISALLHELFKWSTSLMWMFNDKMCISVRHQSGLIQEGTEFEFLFHWGTKLILWMINQTKLVISLIVFTLIQLKDWRCVAFLQIYIMFTIWQFFSFIQISFLFLILTSKYLRLDKVMKCKQWVSDLQ